MKFKDLEVGEKFKTLSDNSEIYRKEKRYVKEHWAFNAWKLIESEWETWEDGHFFRDRHEVIKI